MNKLAAGIKTLGILLVFLLVSACGGTSNATPTPLNPALYPPPGTPQGLGEHTPVITPISDGGETSPIVSTPENPTLAPNDAALNVNGNSGGNVNGAFAPTV